MDGERRLGGGGWGGDGGGGITVASVDFLLPLTKSHHFRRLTSACDKCSTSSSLPISLELETPEASAACKIKNDHLIHSSTKYISGERKKWARDGGRQRESTLLLCCSVKLLNSY